MPYGKRVHLVTYQVDLVSLTEFHESDEDLSRIAAALEVFRPRKKVNQE